MSILLKLAGQTAIYGLSSILGRLLNYFLVPLYIWLFSPAEYGVVTEFYSYVAFFAVLLTFGLETTYFRFVAKSDDPEKTFNELFSLVLIINGAFLVLILIFSQAIANAILLPQFQYVVVWLGFILSFDAVTALVLAKLRQQNQAKRFAMIQLSSIAFNILCNLIFILYAKRAVDAGDADGLASVLYDPAIGIGYIFLANLFSSMLKPVMLFKEISAFRFSLNRQQLKPVFYFATPIAIAGFAGIINETLDRPLVKFITYHQTGDLNFAESQVGIYGANYKLAILITLFIQAFRYAAEPFFFSQEKNADKGKVYSKVMTWFVITVSFLFITVSLSLDVLKWFLPNEAYWEGLYVVPVLLLANVFLGIYYNQSIWYKLADKPKFGAYISLGGALVTILLNVMLIPLFGYGGAAWATLIVYCAMAIASWYLGQKYYPIRYNVRKIGLYLGAALVLVLLGLLIQGTGLIWNLVVWFIFSALFLGLVWFMEQPWKSLKKR